MMSWLIIIFGLIFSWELTDVRAESAFNALFCPVLFGCFVIAALIKLVGNINGSGSGGGHDGGAGGYSGGGDCGGDGGGC